MRKQKKESKIIYRKGILAIIERIKNDNNGNPKFLIQFINKNDLVESQSLHATTYNNQYYTLTSYNIDLDIVNYIDTNIIKNYN